jgi:hypothetical protein
VLLLPLLLVLLLLLLLQAQQLKRFVLLQLDGVLHKQYCIL